MDNDSIIDTNDFVQMACEFPVRTGIFTFSLPAFAAFQLLNGLVNGGSLAVIAGFAVVATICSILLAQYQVAAYRRERIARHWPEP